MTLSPVQSMPTSLFVTHPNTIINPFMSFAKDQTNRIFAAGSQHTKKYILHVPDPPQLELLTYAVDASYPTNCDEPYEITGFSQEQIYSTLGFSGTISIKVLDWQNDVDKVTLVAPELTGEQYTPFTHKDDDNWELMLSNSQGAGPGEYLVRIIASSSGSGSLPLYEYCELTVTGAPTELSDVTPPWLQISGEMVCNDGDYAYIAGNSAGFFIVDYSDPENPEVTGHLSLPNTSLGPDSRGGLAVSGGYAYLVHDQSYPDFSVIDISNPEAPELIVTTSFQLSTLIFDIAYFNGYIYAINNGSFPDLIGTPTDPSDEDWEI
jgi:hypothetical protein